MCFTNHTMDTFYYNYIFYSSFVIASQVPIMREIIIMQIIVTVPLSIYHSLGESLRGCIPLCPAITPSLNAFTTSTIIFLDSLLYRFLSSLRALASAADIMG